MKLKVDLKQLTSTEDAMNGRRLLYVLVPLTAVTVGCQKYESDDVSSVENTETAEVLREEDATEVSSSEVPKSVDAGMILDELERSQRNNNEISERMDEMSSAPITSKSND